MFPSAIPYRSKPATRPSSIKIPSGGYGGILVWEGGRVQSAFGFLINRAGVGGALLVDGEVFRGFRGGAGEVGHTIVDIHGAKCSCGNYGCLETLVNEQRLIREVSTGLKMGQKPRCLW